jgi:peptide/nickel transport system substrate-binding protein
MMRFARSGATMAVLAVAGATALAACGSSSTSSSTSSAASGVYGSVPAAATGAAHTGTITVVQPANSAPTWILPIITSAFNSVYTVPIFDYQMYRPLYWLVNGTAPKEYPALSLASDPTASNGDKTFTINLKSSYKWSDGKPITSQDILFWYDLTKAAIAESPANWAFYTPKIGIPDQVASVTAPNASTVVFNMKSAINPTWFWQNELGAIQPMPSFAWAKASASGPILNFTNPANATKIYNFLAAQSKSGSTWATNPVWKIVDGPYTLSSFNTTSGAFTMTPNPAYGGPKASAGVSAWSSVPYTSDTAEYNAVRSASLDMGYVPPSDLPQINTIKNLGYNAYGNPDFGWEYVAYNFKDTTGDFNNIIGQLYIRQALAHLQDQPGAITAFFNNAASQAYGPVPSIPKSPYTPANAVNNPYPFSTSTAVSILKSHGWNVVPGGTDTCAKPGTSSSECGAGIPAGTKLAWPLVYTTTPTNIGQQVTALASEAKKAGIEITLSSSNFNYMIANYNNPAAPKNINKWAMQDFGGFTNSTYPTTFGVFNCAGSSNLGSYCNPQADKLINDSLFSTSPSAVTNEASYLTTQQPGLFQPNPVFGFVSGAVLVWKKDLSGPPTSFQSVTQLYPNPELWYFTGSK